MPRECVAGFAWGAMGGGAGQLGVLPVLFGAGAEGAPSLVCCLRCGHCVGQCISRSCRLFVSLFLGGCSWRDTVCLCFEALLLFMVRVVSTAVGACLSGVSGTFPVVVSDCFGVQAGTRAVRLVP